MGTKRQPRVAVVALVALAGCTWGRSKPEDCARFAVSAGNARLEQLAVQAGVQRVAIRHQLCSDKRERLEGLAPIARDEVGWCAHVEEEVPASAIAAAANVQQWCAAAVDRRIAYANWSSAIGTRFLFVAQYDVLEHERGGGSRK